MSKIEDLDKLDRAIKDAEIRLKSIQTAIENISKEISTLAPRKLELEQNIEFHKKVGVIPIAHEHGKVKSELSKVSSRLSAITNDQKKAIQACIDVEFIIQKFKKDYAELVKTSHNNVLWGLFGVKRGKK